MLSARTDLRVLGFAFAASALAGLLFGIVPALELFGSDLSPRLREESGGAVGSRRSARWRRGLVVGQVALSVVVLAAAGLFTRSLQRLLSIDPGFEVKNVVTFGVSPELSGYSKERSLEYFERLEEKLRGLPGVEGAAMLDNALLADSDSSSTVRIDGYEAAEGEDMNFRFYDVSPGYFGALKVRVLAGRTFQPSDRAGAPLVAVINEVTARKYFPKGDAVGRRLARRRDEDKWIEIIGIVRDGPMSSLTEPTPRGVYLPVAQDYDRGGMNFYVRAAGLGPVVPAIPRVVRDLDPLVPVVDLRTLEGQAEISLFTERMAARLSTAFAVLATFLAALGLYGVVALAVTGRRRELGVRMALGADPRSVSRMVVRDGLRPVGWGLLVGLLAAVPAAFLLKSLLYEVQPFDLPTLFAVPLLLASAALAACWLPARRASRIDPIDRAAERRMSSLARELRQLCARWPASPFRDRRRALRLTTAGIAAGGLLALAVTASRRSRRKHGGSGSGSEVRAQDSGEESGVHPDRHSDARARDRRQHGDFQRDPGVLLAPLPVPGGVPPGRAGREPVRPRASPICGRPRARLPPWVARPR